MSDFKDSRFTGDAEEELTPRPGLRASNTTETLKPREVVANKDPYLGPTQYDDFIGLSKPVQKTDSVINGNDQYLVGQRGEIARKLDSDKLELAARSLSPEKYNCLPVDWPAARETMGLPKSPEPKKIYSVAELAGRIERLEEQLDGLLDRIYRFNIKSTHKL